MRPRHRDRTRMIVIASNPREGRVLRQVRRCFIAYNFRPLTMSEIWRWVYPDLERAKHWHRWSVRRALLKLAKPMGRRLCWDGRAWNLGYLTVHKWCLLCAVLPSATKLNPEITSQLTVRQTS